MEDAQLKDFGARGRLDAAQSLRREFLGVPITAATLAETIAMSEEAMCDRRPVRHVCINVAKFVAMRSDVALDQDVRSSDIISVDGAGILWAARALGIDVPERVAGVDLMESLIELCARRGYRPYFLGATQDVLKNATARMQALHPDLRLAGWHDGYFATEQEAEVVEHIRASHADCLFVAMPTPKKEKFVAKYHQAIGAPFIMGIGGSLDVYSGLVKRAPKWVQALGLEWLFRTAQEPGRLGPRYLKTNAAFAWIMADMLLEKLGLPR
jgi:N-acetylglucosaminyldiphosphoundecaprenol N-acetyl-beta-D-mannosaminyltransferase